MTLAATTDPLRLSHCPGCGYALEGLPPEGTCPECGGAYRGGVIVLHGFGTGLATGTTRAFVTLLVVNVSAAAFMLSRSHRRERFDAIDLLYPGIIVAWTAWAVWKRWRSDMPGLVRIWLSPDGAAQVNNPTAGAPAPAPGRLTPWDQIQEVRIDSFNDETAKVQMTGPTTFWRGKQTIYADVACDRERAAAVLRQVEAWRADARTAEARRCKNPAAA